MTLICYPVGDRAPWIAPAAGDRVWGAIPADPLGSETPFAIVPAGYGWEVLCQTEFLAAWNGGDGVGDMLVRGPPGLAGVASRLGHGLLTFDLGCIFRTEPGVDLWLGGPANVTKDGIMPLSGAIEADWMPVAATMNWRFTRPGPVRFAKGEPICHLLPIARGTGLPAAVQARAIASDPALVRDYVRWRNGRGVTRPERHGAALPDAAVALRIAPDADTPDRVVETAGWLAAGRGAVRESDLRSAGILYEEGFLDRIGCEALIGCFERQGHLLAKASDGNTFFDNRFLWFTQIPVAERTCRMIMQTARTAIREKIRRFHGEAQPLYSDTIQLVRWGPDQAMRPHADQANPDGTRHATPHRDYAAIVYLNDNYTGGHLYFPTQGIAIRPRAGLLVAFSGGLSHMHGVTELTEGIRYTMPGWYTREPARQDRSELEAV
ncbi:MAG: DUF6065 family protein [Acetobacteraceae bacterium]